jgi:S1-C subfamily serine protease
MTTKLIITHLSGAKQNQIDQLRLDGMHELVLGRDPSAQVVIDAKDDLAGRRHASIRINTDDAGRMSFTLADLGSQNGTFLNGQKIGGPTELMPGDTIELARGGPKLGFDVQPLPPYLAPRTRVMAAMQPATRVMDAAPTVAATAAPAPVMAAKQGVGMETVQGLLAEERKAQNRNWMYGAAAVLAVIAIGGGALQLMRPPPAPPPPPAGPATLSAQQIYDKFGAATVVVYLNWSLYDGQTGQKIFQKYFQVNDGTRVAAYIKLPDGKTVRWLTTDDDGGTNLPVGEEGRGSGFVVNSNGLIITNKHVGAGWNVSFGEIDKTGAVFQLNADGHPVVNSHGEPVLTPLDQQGYDDLAGWIPASGGLVFQNDLPVPISGARSFRGANDDLEVQFPGSATHVQARMVSFSDVADAALVKIDAGSALPTVQIAADNAVHAGEQVVVLGYPGSTPETIEKKLSDEAGQFHEIMTSTPNLTVTTGDVSAVGKPPSDSGTSASVGEMGTVYELSDNSTGHGNSGGPVFNAQGQVIGLFTYGLQAAGATVSFAVPIHFARDLINPAGTN